MRTVLQHRLVLSLALTSVVGVLGLQAWPFPAEHLVLALIQAERPGSTPASSTPTRRCGSPRRSSR